MPHSVERCGDRRTRHIGWRQARNLREAIHYADKRLVELGRPLNTFVTVNFGHTACPPEFVSATFEKLRDNHFVRWLRYEHQICPTTSGSSKTPAETRTFIGSFTFQNSYGRRSKLNSPNG